MEEMGERDSEPFFDPVAFAESSPTLICADYEMPVDKLKEQAILVSKLRKEIQERSNRY